MREKSAAANPVRAPALRTGSPDGNGLAYPQLHLRWWVKLSWDLRLQSPPFFVNA